MEYIDRLKIKDSNYVNNRIDLAKENLLKYIKNLPEEQQADYKQKITSILKKEIINEKDVIDFFDNYEFTINEMKQVIEKRWLKLDFKKYLGYLKESIEFLVNNYDTKEDEDKIKYLLDYMHQSNNIEKLKDILTFYNSIVHKYNQLEMTSIDDYINKKQPPHFLVHSLGNSKILKDDQNYRKGELSTSYITEEQLGTYASKYGSVGFIYPYEEVISAYPEDIYSWVENRKEEEIDPLKKDKDFIGKSITQTYPFVFPLKLIIEKNKELSKKITGNILADQVYNEVLIKDTVKPTGIYIMDNGLKDACHGYQNAKEMAESWNLPLVEIDKSIYRVQAGLEPFSRIDKYNIILSMIDQVCEKNSVWSNYRDYYRVDFYDFIDEEKSDYFMDEVWKKYLKLRETNQMTSENVKKELNQLMGYLSEQDMVDVLKNYRNNEQNSNLKI